MDTSLPFWVSMPILRSIVMHAAKTDKELSTICRMGGIRVDDLNRTEQKLSLATNCALMEAALTVSGDPYLGLHIGEKLTPSILSATGHLVQSCQDMLTALGHVQQFTAAFTRLYQYRLEVEAEEARYYCEPLPVWNDLSPETARQSVDISFAGTLHIACLLTGRNLRPKRVMYRYARIPNTQEYERILHCRPVFGQDANCLVFHLSDLKYPVLGYNQELYLAFQQMLQEELKKNENGASFSERVRRVMLEQYRVAFPALEDIAALLHMTPRTLQRKLKSEHTGFQSLSDSIRQVLACELLGNPSLSLAEIAFKLGYAGPGPFGKAFKQWIGQTPGEFRASRQTA